MTKLLLLFMPQHQNFKEITLIRHFSTIKYSQLCLLIIVKILLLLSGQSQKDFATEEYVRDNIDLLGQQLNTDIAISGEILVFELSSSRAKEYCIPGKCLIADSAHSFHPLAGQGLNLGIADIDVLVDEFKKPNQKEIIRRH